MKIPLECVGSRRDRAAAARPQVNCGLLLLGPRGLYLERFEQVVAHLLAQGRVTRFLVSYNSGFSGYSFALARLLQPYPLVSAAVVLRFPCLLQDPEEDARPYLKSGLFQEVFACLPPTRNYRAASLREGRAIVDHSACLICNSARDHPLADSLARHLRKNPRPVFDLALEQTLPPL